MLEGATTARNLRELKKERTGQGLSVSMPKFFQEMAANMGVDHNELWVVLKSTAFKGEVKKYKDNGGNWTTNVIPPTDEQMYALMMVANAYGLNPFTKEIYAFPDKQNGIVPVVGVDGWLRIANSNPAMDGYEVRSSEKLVKVDDDAKECPEWMEGVVYRKDRAHPIIVREYLDECYRPAFKSKDGNKTTGPWQTHTKRMLRHKALIQAIRTAFGFAGVYEEDEAQRIIEAKVIDTTPMIDGAPTTPDTSEFDRLAGRLLGDEMFTTFLDECARASGTTVGGIKVEGAKDFASFRQAFEVWAAKQKPADTPKPKRTRERAEDRAARIHAELNGKPQEQAASDGPPPIETVNCPYRGVIEATECFGCEEAPACAAAPK